jgi:hypothetical protein
MALPLALGSAMFVMSAAFAQTPDVRHTQAALSSAWHCMLSGGLCTLFCRLSVAFLQRAAERRLREIRSIFLVCPAG